MEAEGSVKTLQQIQLKVREIQTLQHPPLSNPLALSVHQLQHTRNLQVCRRLRNVCRRLRNASRPFTIWRWPNILLANMTTFRTYLGPHKQQPAALESPDVEETAGALTSSPDSWRLPNKSQHSFPSQFFCCSSCMLWFSGECTG